MSICVENVSYIYGKGTPFERAAIEDIDLTIDKGEFIGIIGHTGSGKSTLIQHLNGLLHPSVGKVTVDGVDLAEKTKEAMVKRHSVGMVFQYPEHQLFEETVAKDIAFGPQNQGCDEEETEKRVKSAMRFAGIDYETFAERSPFRLSGGQQRRVAIAGVIAMHPDFLILDEPSAGLDPVGRREIFSRIQGWYKKGVFSVILVSHNMDDIARLATRLLVMHQGRLVLDGEPMDIFLHHREMLKECGVDAPPLTQTLLYLKEKGIPVPETARTVEEAAEKCMLCWEEGNNAYRYYAGSVLSRRFIPPPYGPAGKNSLYHDFYLCHFPGEQSMVLSACDRIHTGMHHDFGCADCHGLESGEAALGHSGIYAPDPCADHTGERSIQLRVYPYQ